MNCHQYSEQRPHKKRGNRIKKVDDWLNERYPKLRAQADKEQVIIFFIDESTAKSERNRGRTWGSKGVTPVVKTTGSRHRLNFISAMIPEDTLRYKTFTGKMDRFTFVSFLRQLVSSVSQPVIVITDGHPAHRASMVKEYLEKESLLLGVHLLPAYSP